MARSTVLAILPHRCFERCMWFFLTLPVKFFHLTQAVNDCWLGSLGLTLLAYSNTCSLVTFLFPSALVTSLIISAYISVSFNLCINCTSNCLFPCNYTLQLLTEIYPFILQHFHSLVLDFPLLCFVSRLPLFQFHWVPKHLSWVDHIVVNFCTI